MFSLEFARKRFSSYSIPNKSEASAMGYKPKPPEHTHRSGKTNEEVDALVKTE